MIAPSRRNAFAALLLLALAGVVPPNAIAAAAPETLVDSTWVDRWTLKNGLDVTVRHIPGADNVAAIVAWRVGRDQDPKGRDGMADLLSELLLSAAAGTIPERSREEMETLRPRGWNLQVTPRFTLLSEVSPPAQFPGVLRQLATRVRGVTVTDSTLSRAKIRVARDAGDRYLGAPELTLFSQLREIGLGVSDEELIARAAGRSMTPVTVREAGDRLKTLYVPANAVLALAGNLDGVDVHTLVRGLFEDIPGGTRLHPSTPAPLRAISRTLRRPGLDKPLGAVGVIGPALNDSTHPGFYLASLVLGRYCEAAWGAAPAPLPGRFRYPVLADPQVVQFFPPTAPTETDPDRLGYSLLDVVEKLAGTVVEEPVIDELRVNHAWLLGGPLTPPFRDRVRRHAGTLNTLASSMAMRALSGDEAFWSRYLSRFLNTPMVEGEQWLKLFRSMDRHIRLLLVPAKS